MIITQSYTGCVGVDADDGTVLKEREWNNRSPGQHFQPLDFRLDIQRSIIS
ncbi:hypothetical protein RchiOBHm_Chr5g0054031 [Rosa chinensis]|uniref:Uncharacterized protein n=1 Tax=Rosa chinensis TaxID=74649 RepID=A0A2P6QG19_ROSCH|nr:hypothetical protein RchiOBHm_Chr5g0054031 [Rosa chinensis]